MGFLVRKGLSGCQCEALQCWPAGDWQVAFGLGSCPPTGGMFPDPTWVYRVEGARDPRLNSPSLCFLRNLNEPESKDRVETLR